MFEITSTPRNQMEDEKPGALGSRVPKPLAPRCQAGAKLGGIEWDYAVHACTVNPCNIT